MSSRPLANTPEPLVSVEVLAPHLGVDGARWNGAAGSAEK